MPPSIVSWQILSSVCVATLSTVLFVIVRTTTTRNKWSREQQQQQPCQSAYEALIGRTPLVRLVHLSECIGRNVYVKMESLNPGGTGKDRAALGMIQAAMTLGDLPPESNDTSDVAVPNDGWQEDKLELSDPIDQLIHQAMANSRTGGLIVEGTSGSTGIALAMLAQNFGHACVVALPDDQATEKQTILRTLGAVVHVVPTAAISNPNHYVNVARNIAIRAKAIGVAALFIDQFENPANFLTHYTQTGPEILQQCPDVSAFVMSSGTGGTIAGVSRYLKEHRPHCRTVLVDPPGSALYNKVEHGVVFTVQQCERSLKRHRYDTIAEGIGLDRLTHNFSLGIQYIDKAVRVTDQEAVAMAHWLLQKEGLWVGSSSAMNVVGAVQTALELPQGAKIVTVVCDGGQRHVTRFWNRDFVLKWGLVWPGDLTKRDRLPDCLKSLQNSQS